MGVGGKRDAEVQRLRDGGVSSKSVRHQANPLSETRWGNPGGVSVRTTVEMSHLPQVSRSLSLPQGVESDVNSACPQVDVTSVRGVTSELAHHELSEEGEKKSGVERGM